MFGFLTLAHDLSKWMILQVGSYLEEVLFAIGAQFVQEKQTNHYLKTEFKQKLARICQ